MKHCENCGHYVLIDDWEYPENTRCCGRIGLMTAKIFAGITYANYAGMTDESAGEYNIPAFIVGPMFGCVLWEPNE